MLEEGPHVTYCRNTFSSVKEDSNESINDDESSIITAKIYN
jgi:hypothetical protein